ncbi:MAG: trypsin-like peptidase domain-containing protein [Marinicella sp.]
MNKILILLIAMLPMQMLKAGHHHRYSAANQITFHNGVTKDFVGSGFIIKHRNKTYAITAKHVLLETMDQGVNSIDIQEQVKQWQLAPFNEDTGVVKLGQLLNANQQEALDIKVLQDDWLVFEVLTNDSTLKTLKPANKPLKSGDTISVYGCNYSNQKNCQQQHYKGTFEREADANLLIKLELDDLSQLRGLSGAPVLNSNHEVVGIVSNVLPDEVNGGFYFAPFNIEAVKSFLNAHE